jgi:preprotein translocase subunit SecA
MMLRFQEDTARYLFRMQIVGPDGQPMTEAPATEIVAAEIPSTELPRLNREVPAAPPVASAERAPVNESAVSTIAVPTRAPSTTIDALEKEFERKKQRELGAARMAGASASSEPSQRNAGAKVGRNDPCPCGSGKKYKKCHGAEG